MLRQVFAVQALLDPVLRLQNERKIPRWTESRHGATDVIWLEQNVQLDDLQDFVEVQPVEEALRYTSESGR